MLRKIFIFACLFAFIVAGAQATIITVDDDPGLGDFMSIQDAINAADPGDIIMAAPGYYAGAVFTKRLEVYGCDEAYIISGVLAPAPPPSGQYPWEVAFFIPFEGEENVPDFPPETIGSTHGSKISHFTINCFDGNNIGLPVVAHFADDITVSHLTTTNPVRGINNGGGKGWTITHNTISGITQPAGPDYMTPTAGILLYGVAPAVIPWAIGANDSLIAFNKITADATGYYACSGIMSVTDLANPGPIKGNKIVHNTSNITGTAAVFPVSGISLNNWLVPPEDVIVTDNIVGFNDCRGMEYGIILIPAYVADCNTLSRNLGGTWTTNDFYNYTEISTGQNRAITTDPPEDVFEFKPIM